MPVSSNITLEQAGCRLWNVVVIGAGPAGATVARELSARGVSVLLVDKATFPRSKVCGCCLNEYVLRSLDHSGLNEIASRGVPLASLQLCAYGVRSRIKLKSAVALSREILDLLLIEKAVATGSSFLSGVSAEVQDVSEVSRTVSLSDGFTTVQVDASMVVVADGLSGRSLASQKEFEITEQPSSRVGAGTILDSAPQGYEPATIYMACGGGGYVGLVCLEDGRLDVAAAFDREFLRDFHNPGAAAQEILRQAKLPAVDGLDQVAWRGTCTLTRFRKNVAAQRVLTIGDASAYVEPFTGQGIAWAISSAKAVIPLVLSGIGRWDPMLIQQWTTTHKRLIGRPQQVSQKISSQLRSPNVIKPLVALLNYFPPLASPVVRYLGAGKWI